MKIQEINIDSLIPYEFNNKIHDETQVNRIANSIKEFWFKNPILIDKNNIIIAWHWRLEWAKKLWLKKVPCIVADDLSEEQVRKFRILDNRLNESERDIENLQIELSTLPDLNIWDLEINIDDEFGDLFTEEESEEKEIEEDEAPEVQAEAKIVEYWDIFQLWKHRLMCWDSTKIEDCDELMNWELADMLFTDPPYWVSYEKKTQDILKTKSYTKIENDDLKGDEFQSFLWDVFTNAVWMLKDTASYYVFSCQWWDQELMMMMMMRNSWMPCRHQLIRVKDAPVFSMWRLDYDYKHEPILYWRIKTHEFQRKWNQDKSVREFKRTENKLHPTMKPVELIWNAILNSSKKWDLILDLFAWSWSTLIACEQLDRNCYTMEIDPVYIEVIIKRFHKINPDAEIKCLNREININEILSDE